MQCFLLESCPIKNKYEKNTKKNKDLDIYYNRVSMGYFDQNLCPLHSYLGYLHINYLYLSIL